LYGGVHAEVKVGGNAIPSPPFWQSGIPNPQKSAFPSKRTFTGRKDSFCPWERKFSNELVNLNFGQSNGLTRNTGARCKIERGPQIFTGGLGIFAIPTTLKLDFNP